MSATNDDRLTVLQGGPSMEDREQKLSEGAENLSGKKPSILRNERFLLVVAGSLMTAGIALILLGWAGAAHTTVLEEQIPYVISGGLLGVALTIAGALCFFSHWVTVLIRENRQHEAARHTDHAALMAALVEQTDRRSARGRKAAR